MRFVFVVAVLVYYYCINQQFFFGFLWTHTRCTLIHGYACVVVCFLSLGFCAFKGCALEARAFQRDIESYRQLNAQIVGVSVDPPENSAQFCSAEGLDFYMLSASGGRVSKLYGSSIT